MARRRHSNQRRRRGSFGFLYKLLSMLVICAAIIVALTLFFRVDTVKISGQQRYTDEQVREASGIQVGDNLILLNKYDVAGNIVEALPYIEDTRINRKLPSTLIIQVSECGKPLAVVQDGYAWLVSSRARSWISWMWRLPPISASFRAASCCRPLWGRKSLWLRTIPLSRRVC